MIEEWKKIPGFNNVYSVSNKGRVRRDIHNRNIIKKKEISQTFSNKGRMFVKLVNNGVYKNFLVHRLVLLAFVGECPSNMEVNHIDGNGVNNCVENLEYLTRSDNAKHAVRTGLWIKRQGSLSGRSKLVEDSVLKIRDLYSSGMNTMRELAEIFNVCEGNIYYIVSRRSWRHI
jgi:hypothetical protein